MAKYKGEFWLQGEEDKTFLGEIKLGKRRSELSLIIPASETPDDGSFLQCDPLRPVLGVTTCGKRITLTDYFQTSFPYSFIQPRSATFCVNAAFVGLPDEMDKIDPEVETATITSDPLVEWCGVSSHEIDLDQSWAVKYSPPAPREIYRNDDFTIELGFGASRTCTRFGVSITDGARIVLKSERPVAWSRLFTSLTNVLDAASIGCGSYCSISQAHAASKAPIYLADFHFHSLFPTSRVKPRSQWLFTLSDLPESAFAKWMEKADELKRARALFFSAKHHQMFAETRILLLTQAVEAYCRIVHEDKRERGYLARHLPKLCKKYTDPISIVFPDRVSRVREVLDFRNDETHSLKMSASSKLGDEQLAMEHFLCLLLEICFMSQLGISIADITEIVERSSIYKQLRRLYKGAALLRR